MKAIAATLALTAGLIVSAGALYESHVTHAEACATLQKEAIRAAQAPIELNSTTDLGFTPMNQFEKVYSPACQPPDDGADFLSAVISGAIVAVAMYAGIGLLARLFKSQHH